jgi:pyrroline-5-carboxylate reductase
METKRLRDEPRIGFVGGGQMAAALIKGLVAAGVTPAKNVWCSDASADQLKQFESLGVHTTTDNATVVKSASIVMICVKPHIVPIVLNEVKGLIQPSHLIISIAAGSACVCLRASRSHVDVCVACAGFQA